MICIPIERPISFRSLFGYQGESDDARALKERLLDVKRDMDQSIALGERNQDVLTDIEQFYTECRHDNWDGYGAKSIRDYSYYEAKRFLEILPTTIPLPEVTVEPDGELAFEWHAGPRNVFSVSMGRQELVYAGLFGVNRVHGVEYFEDELPKPILENLGRHISLKM